MKKTLLSLVTVLTGFTVSQAQTVNIPDANFKAYLVGNTAINANGDGEIQLTEAQAFTGTIECTGLGINDLTGIEAFTSLTILRCQSNNLTSLDVSANTALTDFRCWANQLTSIDISNNTALDWFQCNGNQISTLDLSNNPLLTYLGCSANLLTELDLSNNPLITEVYCNMNQLTDLDLSRQTGLITLWCQNNQLSYLNIRNGNSTNISIHDFRNNPNLSCIMVDDVADATANLTNKDAGTSYNTFCCPSSGAVNIPDANFKAYLVGNTNINTNGDGEIQCTEAQAFMGVMVCENLSITDLTGIEAFSALPQLVCSGNPLTTPLDLSRNTALGLLWANNNDLTSLDLSKNTALTTLQCYDNQLTALDLSNNTALLQLNCFGNQLTALDVSSNTALMQLGCFQNQITALDVTNNTALTTLQCHQNPISSLDLSNNTDLLTLTCNDCQLTTLDVSNNPALGILQCTGNQISTLDVSNNTALLTFRCGWNNLTHIDVQANTSLTFMECHNNLLESLNVKNGNNSNFTFFNAGGNANLTCIEVDDSTYSATNWTSGGNFLFDTWASFSENCSGNTNINEIAQMVVQIYPNPANTVLNVTLENPANIAIVNLLGETLITQTAQSGNNNIDVSLLAAGVYFVRVENNTSIKFVKE